MAVNPWVVNSLSKLAKSGGRLGTTFILNSLMSQSVADEFSTLLGDSRNLRFHDDEIKILKSSFTSNLKTTLASRGIKFGNLDVKDNQSTMVSQVELSVPIKKAVIDFYNIDELTNLSFYLILRKIPPTKGFTKNKSIPPILQFLEKPYDIGAMIGYVKSSNGNYSSFKNVFPLQEMTGSGGSFVCFFDFLGRGSSKTLAELNAVVKNEKISAITNNSYINSNSSRLVFHKITDIVEDTLIKKITSQGRIREENDFKKLFEEAVSGTHRISHIKIFFDMSRSLINALRSRLGITAPIIGNYGNIILQPILKRGTAKVEFNFKDQRTNAPTNVITFDFHEGKISYLSKNVGIADINEPFSDYDPFQRLQQDTMSASERENITRDKFTIIFLDYIALEMKSNARDSIASLLL